MVELRFYTPEKLNRSKTTLLLCDEASITCSTFRNLQNSIAGDKHVILAMPDNEYQKGKRGYAKAHILASVARNIRGIMPISFEDANHELRRDWAGIKVNGSIEWKSATAIVGREHGVRNLLKIDQTDDPFDIEMIDKAKRAIESSNCWLDPAGVVFAQEGKVLIEGASTSYNDSHCTTIPVNFRDLKLNSGERMIFCDSLHAERVGISHAAEKGISLKGSTMYVSKFPCRPCAQVVIAAGIKRIVFENDSYGLIETADLFEANKIDLKKIVR